MRKISVSAQISLQYPHENKAVQERQKAGNQYIFNGGFTMNMDILAVDTSTLTVYDFLGDGESEQDLLQRAYNSNTRDIAHYEAIIAENPESNSDGFFTKQLENAKKREYKVVTWNEYITLKRKRYIDNGEMVRL